MKSPVGFKPEKALHAILYVADKLQREDNLYATLKVIYFADKDHLHRYGRFIFGDNYVAMSHGPAPSGAYDIVKYVRGDGWDIGFEEARAAFTVKDNKHIQLYENPNIDVFSDSDIECLDRAIAEYGKLSFSELKRRSHDAAYDQADLNESIPIEAIAATFADGQSLIEHLHN